MAIRTRLLMVALVAGMTATGNEAKARRQDGTLGNRANRPETRHTRRAGVQQSRPAQRVEAVASPCSRHSLRVQGGAVLIDGRRVHQGDEAVWLLGKPVWRKDGAAVAWLERHRGAVRLVVVPDVSTPATTLTWALPGVGRDDLVAWMGSRRIHVGAVPVVPRAIATWTEDA